MMAHQVLTYYRQHSPLTDPGRNVSLYETLPHDIPGLARTVQGLLIPPYSELLRDGYQIEPEAIDNTVFGLRRVEDLLERIQLRFDAPLTVERPPIHRIGAICRNFAVLLVSMLRHQGIPARARVGFGRYFSVSYAADHRISEYWHEGEGRWILVDPMIDQVQQKRNKVTFDTLDIGTGDPFWLAGDVWLRARRGELDPLDFGDSDTDKGMPPIRYALLQDFAYLNKHEMLGNDDWGDLITKPDSALTQDDLKLLDQIATLTLSVDQRLDEIQSLFEVTAYGQAVQAGMAS